MSGMKRIFALLLLLSFLFIPFGTERKKATAESTYYAYIPGANVAFYSDAEEATRLLLFYLPETYFVCVIGETNNYYRVSYLEDSVGTRRADRQGEPRAVRIRPRPHHG